MGWEADRAVRDEKAEAVQAAMSAELAAMQSLLAAQKDENLALERENEQLRRQEEEDRRKRDDSGAQLAAMQTLSETRDQLIHTEAQLDEERAEASALRLRLGLHEAQAQALLGRMENLQQQVRVRVRKALCLIEEQSTQTNKPRREFPLSFSPV